MPHSSRFLLPLTLAACSAACSPLPSTPAADAAPPDASAGAEDAATEAPSLHTTLERRLTGDRTGACVAAAVVDGDVERAFVCANDASARALDGSTAFEIGSISKTMTGLLLAELLNRGALTLDDPLSTHLPPGTHVPSHGDDPIRLRHLVTHTSGLPSLPARMHITDPANPYAALTEADLLASLADADLTVSPGAHWAYSNFGYMLLSYVVARAGGENVEAQLREQLFAPLGMAHSFIDEAPTGVSLAQGHLSTGSTTKEWDFPADLAGVGGVRASLDDMVLYARAALGQGDPQVVARLAQALEPLPSQHGEPAMGLGWVLAPLQGRTIAMHDGGTGGFSSLVAVDREHERAVVLLIDTSFGNVGGVEELALHLLAPETFALPAPRLVAAPDAALLAALSGRYRLGDLTITLRSESGVLFAQASGQGEFELGFDSHGDFFPLAFDALLTPVRRADGTTTFRWTQGQTVEAERLP